MAYLIDRTGKIRMANTSAVERLKIPVEELVGYGMKQLVIPEDASRFDPFMQNLFSGKMATLEARLNNQAKEEEKCALFWSWKWFFFCA